MDIHGHMSHPLPKASTKPHSSKQKGYSASAIHLPSKRICLTYGYRFQGAYGIRASILSPDGDLIANTETIIRDDGAVSDLGYPKTCCLIDGRIFVVYYINRNTDATNVVFSSGLLITLKVNRPKNGLRRESLTRSNKDS